MAMCIDLSLFIFPKKFLYFLQKRTVRTQCAANYRALNKPLFQKFGIFEIYSLLSFQVGSFVPPGNVTSLFSKLYFKLEVQIHNYSTRYAESYNTHVCRTNMKGKWKVFYKLGPRTPTAL